MMSPLWLLLLLGAVLVSSELKSRTCCKYSSSDLCSDSKGCILRDPLTSELTSPHLSQCTASDKKNKTSCTPLEKEPTEFSELGGPLPFHLVPYAFQSNGAMNLSAVEVNFLYSEANASRLQYHMFSTELCTSEQDEENVHCKPRCVDINLLGGPEGLPEGSEVVHDCEVGFYRFEDGVSVRETVGHTYQMDWCVTGAGLVSCHSVLFNMPPVSGNSDPLLMLDRVALEKHNDVVVLLPNAVYGQEIIPVHITHKDTVHVVNATVVNGTVTVLSKDLPSLKGQFRIGLDGLGDVADFTIPDQSDDAALSVSLLVLLAILVVLALAAFAYYRYTVVRNVVVNPNRLLDSGRCKPKSVFIITNVDNRHHIDVVLGLSKYLKSHCGVGEVYFALDPRTGITSQSEHDPWKWALHVTDLMAASEDSCLVFIAAPPSALGLPIYKDLPNNQAFVSAQYLKGMVDGGRVAVLHLPYSDPGTVPGLVPVHVRNGAHAVPRRMNDFLCQLLDVKKRELCACLPIQLVKPQIAPHSLTSFHGGKELQENIDNLTAKVDLYRAELKAQGNTLGPNGTISQTTTEDAASAFSDSEERGLLRKKAPVITSEEKEVVKKKQKPLDIDIEPGVMSLKEAEGRDRGVNPEFQNV